MTLLSHGVWELTRTKKYSCYCFVSFGVILTCAQGLLLSLNSGVNPGGAGELYMVFGSEPESPAVLLLQLLERDFL